MTKIETLKNKSGESFYPLTSTKAVVDENGNTIEDRLVVADGEDLVADGNVLRLKDRPNTDGMGYVILRKDKTFQEQVKKPNTIYEIRYDFDLGRRELPVVLDTPFVLPSTGGAYYRTGDHINVEAGMTVDLPSGGVLFDSTLSAIIPAPYTPTSKKSLYVGKLQSEAALGHACVYSLEKEVVIPENCVLKFEGGSLGNGILVGNNTSIDAKLDRIFNDLILKETFVAQAVYSDWFNLESGSDNTNKINSILNIISSKIMFKEYSYPLYVSVSNSGNIAPSLLINRGNKHIDFNNNTIKVAPNSSEKYCCIEVRCDNVLLSNLKQYGDVVEHKGETGEQGHGLLLSTCNNVEVENCEFSYNWGDGIDIIENYHGTSCPTNIKIHDCKCLYNRRQGISIEGVRGLLLDRNVFAETGRIKYTGPGSGIDIEPWQNKEYSKIKDVVITNNKIYNNVGQNIQIQCNTRFENKEESNNVKLENNIIYDEYKDEVCILKDTVDFTFKNNTIGNEAHSISVTLYQNVNSNVLNNIIYGNLYIQNGHDAKIIKNSIFNNKTFEASLWGSSSFDVINTNNTIINSNSVYSSKYAPCMFFAENADIAYNLLQGVGLVNLSGSILLINNVILTPQIKISNNCLIKMINNNIVNNGKNDFCVIIDSKERDDEEFSLSMINNTLTGFDFCTGFYRAGSKVYIKTNQAIKPEKYGSYTDYWIFENFNVSFYENRINVRLDGKQEFDYDGQPKGIKRIGGIQHRPTNVEKNTGMMYSDWDIYAPIFYINGKWRLANGIAAPNEPYMPVVQVQNRPKGLDENNIGLQLFDTTLNKPIWWNGTEWVDALGRRAGDTYNEVRHIINGEEYKFLTTEDESHSATIYAPSELENDGYVVVQQDNKAKFVDPADIGLK